MINPTAKQMAEDFDNILSEISNDIVLLSYKNNSQLINDCNAINEKLSKAQDIVATAAREAREQALEEVKETAQVLFAPGLSTAICAMCDALKQQSGE